MLHAHPSVCPVHRYQTRVSTSLGVYICGATYRRLCGGQVIDGHAYCAAEIRQIRRPPDGRVAAHALSRFLHTPTRVRRKVRNSELLGRLTNSANGATPPGPFRLDVPRSSTSRPASASAVASRSPSLLLMAGPGLRFKGTWWDFERLCGDCRVPERDVVSAGSNGWPREGALEDDEEDEPSVRGQLGIACAGFW